MDNTVANLSILIRQLAVHRNLATSTVSRLVTGSGDTLKRLERRDATGTPVHRISTDRAARSMRALSELWPADLEWPRDIPRPPKSKKEKAA
ncbi:hypothetical protein MASR1M49_42010 [Pararhodobacter aggregans]